MKLTIFTMAVLGIVTMVTADCDSMKCIRPLSIIDISNPANTCPYLNTAIGCLKTVCDTCYSLDNDGKTTIQDALHQVINQFDNTCTAEGYMFSQNLYMVILITVLGVSFGRF